MHTIGNGISYKRPQFSLTTELTTDVYRQQWMQVAVVRGTMK